MKILGVQGDRFEFRIGRREKSVFSDVLDAFPVVPIEHHRLSRGQAEGVEDPNQALLTESMSVVKAEWRKRLDGFLANGDRFVEDDRGYRLTLTREEMEWLLRILNDVRVGSWLRLGCPDPDQDETPKPTPDTLRYAILMEVAAHFQFALLAALDGTQGVGWGGRGE